jgi:hypothetical protein
LWPITRWSTASPVIHGAKYGLYRICGNRRCRQELLPEVIDYCCTLRIATGRTLPP